MKIISHRANLNGRDPANENYPDMIEEVLGRGFDVEVDVWFHENRFFLGHDNPEHQVDMDLLKHPRVWVHAKNKEVVPWLKKERGVHWFWHENDKMTLTSNGYIWCFPGHEIDGGIMVDSGQGVPRGINIVGVCTNDPLSWKKLID